MVGFTDTTSIRLFTHSFIDCVRVWVSSSHDEMFENWRLWLALVGFMQAKPFALIEYFGRFYCFSVAKPSQKNPTFRSLFELRFSLSLFLSIARCLSVSVNDEYKTNNTYSSTRSYTCCTYTFRLAKSFLKDVHCCVVNFPWWCWNVCVRAARVTKINSWKL